MRCLVDENYKINVFYALKGGSRQIQNFWRSSNIDPHCRNYNKLYDNWLICRNPYDRIASVFLQRYVEGQSTHLYKPKNFCDFVNILYDQYFEYKEQVFCYKHLLKLRPTLEEYHTLPLSSFMPPVKFKVFKLENIIFSDANTETNRYSTYKYKTYKTSCLSSLEYNDLCKLKENIKITKSRPEYCCFYNKNILNKIEHVYKTDLDLLDKYKIKYDRPI